jgi:hypothetical protein
MPPNPTPDKADTPTPSTACTSEGKNTQGGIVEALAAALQALSPADGARLAAMLLNQGNGQGGP